MHPTVGSPDEGNRDHPNLSSWLFHWLSIIDRHYGLQIPFKNREREKENAFQIKPIRVFSRFVLLIVLLHL